MATIQSSSPLYSSQDLHRELAIRLVDARLSRSSKADLWAVSSYRLELVLTEKRVGFLPDDPLCVEPAAQQQ
jgi:hypothetical protein